MVPPVPREEKFTTVFGTLRVVADTAPLKLAVPPVFCTVRVLTPETLVPVMLAATPLAVSRVRLWALPVTAARVMAPVPLVALVFRITSLPRVSAVADPAKFKAALLELMVPFSVRVLGRDVNDRPPVKAL